MSLIQFHRGLIAAGILFCFGYGVWELTGAGRAPGAASPVLGTVFVLLGFALAVYLSRLNRILGYEREHANDREQARGDRD